MLGRPEWEKIPVLALVESALPIHATAARAAGFVECQAKFDRLLVLQSVARMVSLSSPLALAAGGR
jgi:hypothetical protein